MVLASAPGKIILFGEHAVVHGQPAIAAPLHAVRVIATAEPARAGAGLTIHAPEINQKLHLDSLDNVPDDLLSNALVFPLQVALAHLRQPVPDLTVTVRSTIPVASGLGSGAALATALIRAFCGALGHPLTNDELNPLVYQVEQRHHGTPSGIDNTVIVYEQPVYFVRGVRPNPFSIPQPFTLLVADTGQSSLTHDAVRDVHTLRGSAPDRVDTLFKEIGAIVERARHAIEMGDIGPLGSLMDRNHALLSELTVSSESLDRLCEAARRAGARGAKLSGGGRGGNMIALVDDSHARAVSAALREAGATHVIQTVIGASR